VIDVDVELLIEEVLSAIGLPLGAELAHGTKADRERSRLLADVERIIRATVESAIACPSHKETR
jgi:hypothetical protein